MVQCRWFGISNVLDKQAIFEGLIEIMVPGRLAG